MRAWFFSFHKCVLRTFYYEYVRWLGTTLLPAAQKKTTLFAELTLFEYYTVMTVPNTFVQYVRKRKYVMGEMG